MPWPIPQPGDIANRAAAIYESEYQRIYTLRFPGSAPAQVDARSPNSTLAVDARVVEMATFDLYAMQARYGQELMVDTAKDWLPRHGSIWGVPQDTPTSAFGNLVLPGGAINTIVPGGATLSGPGLPTYAVINAGTIEATGTFSIGISAVTAGSAGNLAAGTKLTFVNPVPGLFSQTGTVDASGITDGQDAENTEVWRGRILERIRQRGGGGCGDDFIQWGQQVLQAAQIYPFSPGVGLITVAIAMPVYGATGAQTGWRVPTTSELSAASAYLNDASKRKPLGAPVVDVIAVTLQPVNFTLHVNPDTTAVQQGVTAALAAYFASSDITIAGTLDISRSDNAISLAAGLYNFDRSAPAGDVAPSTVTSLLTLGTVSWT